MAFKVKDLIIHVLPQGTNVCEATLAPEDCGRTCERVSLCGGTTLDCLESQHPPTELTLLVNADPEIRKILVEDLRRAAKEPETPAEAEEIESRLRSALDEVQRIKDQLKG
jgi:hypothetical protein